MLGDAIGWVSSLILVATIGQQVFTQWKEKSSRGVSRWLFLGQIAASAGFAVYSFLKRDWVFVTTNCLMLVNALIGWKIARRHRSAS